MDRRFIKQVFKANTTDAIDLLAFKVRLKDIIDGRSTDNNVGLSFFADDQWVFSTIVPANVMAVGRCINDVSRSNHGVTTVDIMSVPTMTAAMSSYHPLD